MRLLLIIIVIACVFALAGWLTFRTSGESVGVTIETKKIQEDSENLLEEGREAAKKVGDAIRDSGRASAPADADNDRPSDKDEPLEERPPVPEEESAGRDSTPVPSPVPN